jgi:hypothetical protein
MPARADSGEARARARVLRARVLIGALLLLATPSLLSACAANSNTTSTPQAAAPTATPQLPAAATTTPAATPTANVRPVPTAPAAQPATSVPVGPTPTVDARLVLVQKVRKVLADLRSGELQATSDYSDGTQAVVTMQFQLREANTPARSQPALHMQTTYTSPSGSQHIERLTFGDQSWQRDTDDAPWQAVPEQEGIYGQVSAFLPQLPAASAPMLASSSPLELHWLDTGRNAEVVLTVNDAGVPQSFQRKARDGTAQLTVTYTQWNGPVNIPQRPPQ